MSSDIGGDPPCWAHLQKDEGDLGFPSEPVVVDLASTDTGGRAGAVWSLPHGGDLDANLVRLDADGGIGAHVNDEVDVVISIVAGSGRLVIDDTEHALRREVFALVPKGSRREVIAGAEGIVYLSIHRSRQPLGIASVGKAPGR